MDAATRITGAVLVVIGLVLIAGIAINMALTNYNRPLDACVSRTDPPDGVQMFDAGEGTDIETSYSVVPFGLKCSYRLAEPGEYATVFLDLGSMQGIFGLALIAVGVIVWAPGAKGKSVNQGEVPRRQN